MLPSTDAPSTTSLVDTLIDIGTIVDRALELRLTDLKLSSAQLRILEALDGEPDGLQPKTLAAILIQEKQSVSGLLQRLEDRALITRTHDSTDRRRVWAKITKAGTYAVEGACDQRAMLEARVARLLDDWGVDPPIATSTAWRDALRELLA